MCLCLQQPYGFHAHKGNRPDELFPWYPAAENGDPSEVSFYENFTFGADGKIYAVRNYCYNTSPPSDQDTDATIHYLCCWKSDGVLLWEAQLEDFPSDDVQAVVNAISVTAEGLTNLILTDSQT